MQNKVFFKTELWSFFKHVEYYLWWGGGEHLEAQAGMLDESYPKLGL